MEETPSEHTGSRRAVRYLMRLPVLDRIKIVKDVVMSELESIRMDLHALGANNVPLLEAMVSLVETLQQTREEIGQQSRLTVAAVHRQGDDLTHAITQEIHGLGQVLTESLHQATQRAHHTLVTGNEKFMQEVHELRQVFIESLRQATQRADIALKTREEQLSQRIDELGQLLAESIRQAAQSADSTLKTREEAMG